MAGKEMAGKSYSDEYMGDNKKTISTMTIWTYMLYHKLRSH